MTQKVIALFVYQKTKTLRMPQKEKVIMETTQGLKEELIGKKVLQSNI